jgi:hypothetical protein
MKKVCLLVFAIILTNFAYSQFFNKVIKSSFLTYQYGDWSESNINYPDNMYVIIDKFNIKITNIAESKYKTYGTPTKKKVGGMQSAIWDAYDKDGKSCLFIMKSYDDSESIICTILYDGYGFQYITSPDKN